MTQSLEKESLRQIMAVKPAYFILPENTRDACRLEKSRLGFMDLTRLLIESWITKQMTVLSTCCAQRLELLFLIPAWRARSLLSCLCLHAIFSVWPFQTTPYNGTMAHAAHTSVSLPSLHFSPQFLSLSAYSVFTCLLFDSTQWEHVLHW